MTAQQAADRFMGLLTMWINGDGWIGGRWAKTFTFMTDLHDVVPAAKDEKKSWWGQFFLHLDTVHAASQKIDAAVDAGPIEAWDNILASLLLTNVMPQLMAAIPVGKSTD